MKALLWVLLGLLVLLPLATTFAAALDFNETISPDDQARFDEILNPVLKIYNFVKYTATVIAVVLLVFAGISFITSGGNEAKRDQAKMMGMYIIIGLVVIWAAPLVVQFVVG
ncbi:MAG: pilin [archaeon]